MIRLRAEFVIFITAIAFLIYGAYLLSNTYQFGIVLCTFGLIGLLFVYQDYQNFSGKSKYVNYSLTTHVQRMLGSYIASLTAFLVVNNTYLPNVIAWLFPIVLITPLIMK